MGNASAVHDLCKHPAALGVDGVGDLLPGGDLLFRDQSGLARVGAPSRARVGAFADDQAQGSALAVVLSDQRAGHTFLARAQAGQWRHDQAVGQFKLTESQGGKQHAQFLSQGIGTAGPN